MMIETNRTFKAYARTNRKVRWQYSEYCGRWESKERAIAEVMERYEGERAEYRIENMETDEVETGFLNK